MKNTISLILLLLCISCTTVPNKIQVYGKWIDESVYQTEYYSYVLSPEQIRALANQKPLTGYRCGSCYKHIEKSPMFWMRMGKDNLVLCNKCFDELVKNSRWYK